MAGIVNKGRKFYISTTAEPDDLDESAYSGLSWKEVGCVVNVGETGSAANVLSQDCWGTKVTQKQVGIINAGDPTVEVGVDYDDEGQIAMRAAANDGNYYAFKIENVTLAGQITPVTEYNRGLVLGPVSSNGGVEDWSNETFTLGLVQERIVVNATTSGG